MASRPESRRVVPIKECNCARDSGIFMTLGLVGVPPSLHLNRGFSVESIKKMGLPQVGSVDKETE